ncbi:MAG: hypothetical protein IPK88_04270 [Saprospiraceae bacterium]|nr:hypothetical protein [Candidatus Defluviibacterium haderslevense]
MKRSEIYVTGSDGKPERDENGICTRRIRSDIPGKITGEYIGSDGIKYYMWQSIGIDNE